MAFAKKTWKDRIAEFPTRRRLTKEDNTSELVTVAREEGTLSQEGDAFSAENMNDLESRIDAEFTEVNGKLQKINGILSINSNYGEIVSENCNYYENGIYYIDVLVTIGTSVPASGQLFSISRGSGTQIISRRLDAILEGATDNYFIFCISNNTFLPNTKPVNAGVYKLKMIIKEYSQ